MWRAASARTEAPRSKRACTRAKASTAASGSLRASLSIPCTSTVATRDGSPASLVVATCRGLRWTARQAPASLRSAGARKRSRYRASRVLPRSIASPMRSQARSGEKRSDSSHTAKTGSQALGWDFPASHSSCAAANAPARSPVASRARAWRQRISVEAFGRDHSMNLRHSPRAASRRSQRCRRRRLTASASWRARNASSSDLATRGKSLFSRASST